MMLLITGGLGFIGSHTAVEALRAGYDVLILDNLRNARRDVIGGIQRAASGRVGFVEGDCRAAALLEKVFTRHEISAVIHFAALKAVSESIDKPLEYYANNLDGLISVLAAAGRKSIRNFVFSSSAAVYGIPQKIPITENHPLSIENTPYGFSKLVAEKIITDFVQAKGEMQVVLLRYFNPIGADASGAIGESPSGVPNNLMPYLIQVASGEQEKLSVFGRDYPTEDGTCIRDFIHITDLAQAHLKALQWVAGREPSAPEVFNIGTGRGHSVLELIHAFERVNGVKLNYEFGPRRAGDNPILYADITKAKHILGWNPVLSIDDAVRDSWRWANRQHTL